MIHCYRLVLAILLLSFALACSSADERMPNQHEVVAVDSGGERIAEPGPADNRELTSNSQRFDNPRYAFRANLKPLWQSRPSDSDTVLLMPNSVHYSALGLLVFDAGDRSIQIFNGATGTFEKKIGREGSGPSEFSYRARIRGSYHEPVIFDPELRRITWISENVSDHKSSTYPGDYNWLTSCSFPSNRMLATASGSHIDSRGPDYFVIQDHLVVDSMDTPFSSLRDAPLIVRQAVLRQLDDSTCITLTLYANDFGLFNSDGSVLATGKYIETTSILPPNVSGEGKNRSYSVPRNAVAGPIDASSWRDYAIVLYEGRSRQSSRLLDFYHRSSLEYAGSILAPMKSNRMAIRGDTITLIGEVDDYPTVAAFLISQ